MRAAAPLALLLLLAVPLAGALAEAYEAPPARAIVQLRGFPSEAQRATLAAHGAPLVLDVIPAAVGAPTAAQRAWLAAQPWVERIDPDAPLERHLDLSTRLIRAGAPALDLGFDGAGVTIAVLDSGIDSTHPDFEQRVLANVVYANGQWVPAAGDLDGHGTHVAGVAAGSGAASGGALRGVAPGAGLVGMDFSRAFTTSTALQAFDWVLRNRDAYDIRVVTNSWGRAESPNTWDPADSLVRASNRLVGEGLVVLFSAGNHGPRPGSVSLEGQNPNVITVGAVDDAATPAGFSGRGPVLDPEGLRQPWVKPDVVASGVAVHAARSAQATGDITQPTLLPSQLPGVGGPAGAAPARYAELSGTSQAAPHVAGIAALMVQANPALTPGQVHNLLRETAIDLGAAGPDDVTGFGLVDARDAVRRAMGLAPDRGNTLLAGGEERYLAEGRLASAAGQVVQTSPVVQVKEQGSVEAAVPVKPGATSVRFDFAWAPAAGSFRVYLVGDATTLGPWTSARLVDGERVISGLVADPEPGMYKLVAQPAGQVNVAYRADAVVAVREQARLPAELEERYRAPDRLGPLEQVRDELQFELDKVRDEARRALPAPGVAPGAAAVAAAAALLARRRR